METTAQKPPSRSGVRNPAVLAWLRLARVFQKIDHRSMGDFRCRNLSSAQFDVLAHVGALEGPTQQELADALLVTKGNVCQLLDRMQAAGLLVRRQEGRSNRLFLTEKGRQLFELAVPEHERAIAQNFSALDADEQRLLLRLLSKLDRSLE